MLFIPLFLPKTPIYSGISDIQFLLILVGAMLVGGFLGAYIAKLFEAIVFFLAGGIVALVLARLWVGTITPEDLRTFDSFREALTTSSPKCWELGAFAIGGILYVLNIRIILALTTAALGGLIIRWVWGDVLMTLHPHGHDLAAVILMTVGTLVQMQAFKGRRELIPPRYRRRDFEK